MRLKLRDKEAVETAQDGRKGGLRSAAEVAAGWHASTRRNAQLLQLLDPVISLAPPVQTMSVGQPPITAWPVRQARSGLKVKGGSGGGQLFQTTLSTGHDAQLLIAGQNQLRDSWTCRRRYPPTCTTTSTLLSRPEPMLWRAGYYTSETKFTWRGTERKTTSSMLLYRRVCLSGNVLSWRLGRRLWAVGLVDRWGSNWCSRPTWFGFVIIRLKSFSSAVSTSSATVILLKQLCQT